MDRREKSATDWSAIEAEAARLYLEAQQSGDWDRAYAWVEEDPANGYAFAKAEAGWALAARLGDVDFPDAPEEVAGPAGRFEALFSRGNMVALAASIIVVIFSTVMVQKWMEVQRYRTPVGAEDTVKLADGSTIHLNTDSAVEVSFKDKIRSVRLLQGEARFDVAHDASRPFVVDAGDVSFRALGTVFDVRYNSDLTELTVVQGRVGVDGEGKRKAVVPAGSYAAISSGTVGVSRLTKPEMSKRTAWSEGMISFEGETLEQAVAELNRYRKKPIVIGSPQIAAVRIGGMVRAEDTDNFIQSLDASFGIRALQGKNSVLLMPRETLADGPQGGHGSEPAPTSPPE